jgi:hypothetical protein
MPRGVAGVCRCRLDRFALDIRGREAEARRLQGVGGAHLQRKLGRPVPERSAAAVQNPIEQRMGLLKLAYPYKKLEMA